MASGHLYKSYINKHQGYIYGLGGHLDHVTRTICINFHFHALSLPGMWLTPWNRLKLYRPFRGGTSFVDHLCLLCLVFVMLSHLFIAALWSPAGKGLTTWLWLVMFIIIVFLLLSHMLSWVRYGTWLYRFLIFAFFLTTISNFR